ncbi:MAG TPA: Hsp20/alpha crystallin family protein [Pseudomonadales bacterium]|nr:Hsp20/alpha crystallin family protein [Pseudomonadales bacterium]
MSQLVYSPFGALNQLHRELNRVFDHYTPEDEPTSYETGNWVPQVDIREDNEGFHVFADIPGVDARDVDITLDRNVLTIKGTRHGDAETSEKGYKRRERATGIFVRQFTLPDTTDEEAISAKMTNGVLEVVIPKGEKHKPRTITIQ